MRRFRHIPNLGNAGFNHRKYVLLEFLVLFRQSLPNAFIQFIRNNAMAQIAIKAIGFQITQAVLQIGSTQKSDLT